MPTSSIAPALLMRTLDLDIQTAEAVLTRWESGSPETLDLFMEGLESIGIDGWTKAEAICARYKRMHDAANGRPVSLSPKSKVRYRKAALAIIARENASGRTVPMPTGWR